MDDRLIHEVRQEASRKNQSRDQVDIMGTDIDSRMVEVAKENAQKAGVSR